VVRLVTNTMNKLEQKKYIIKTWKLSSGKRISAMLRRYWSVDKSDDIVKKAKEIFNV